MCGTIGECQMRLASIDTYPPSIAQGSVPGPLRRLPKTCTGRVYQRLRVGHRSPVTPSVNMHQSLHHPSLAVPHLAYVMARFVGQACIQPGHNYENHDDFDDSVDADASACPVASAHGDYEGDSFDSLDASRGGARSACDYQTLQGLLGGNRGCACTV